MKPRMPAYDPGGEMRLRRSALHGLLQFSVERRYPPEIVASLREMLHRREIVVCAPGDGDALERSPPHTRDAV